MSTGSFVWYELLTSDPNAAIAFYTEVIGWKTQPFEGAAGGEPYTMWVSAQGPLGGVMKLPEEAKKMGAPPHWMGHVEVADVDASAAKVQKLGGRVYVPPTDVPTVGRFAVVADPFGASLSLFKPAQPMTPNETKNGEFCWRELMSEDAAKALEFYKAICGWELLQEMDMGPAGKYLLYGQNGKQYGGMMNKPKEMPVSAWGYYIDVEDLDATMKRATSKGAKVLHGPMDVPGNARVVLMTDPQGAFFALHSMGKRLGGSSGSTTVGALIMRARDGGEQPRRGRPERNGILLRLPWRLCGGDGWRRRSIRRERLYRQRAEQGGVPVVAEAGGVVVCFRRATRRALGV